MISITTDKHFMSIAISTMLQLEGRLADNQHLEVIEWEINEDNHLVLICEPIEESVN